MAISRIYRSKIKIYVAISTAIPMMLFLPYGSIDPREIGFYLAIVRGIFFGMAMSWFFDKYSNGEPLSRGTAIKTDRILRVVIVLEAIGTILAMMFVSRYGSSNPSEAGFYISIAVGLAYGLGNYWAYNKYFKPTEPYLEDMGA